MLTNAPRGTKDILPDTVGEWNYIEGKIREICGRYGFEEIRTPLFEHTELFHRGIGDGTDVVDKEMYTFEVTGEADGASYAWSCKLSYDYSAANVSGNLADTIRQVYLYVKSA